jgi:hypothetical protein
MDHRRRGEDQNSQNKYDDPLNRGDFHLAHPDSVSPDLKCLFNRSNCPLWCQHLIGLGRRTDSIQSSPICRVLTMGKALIGSLWTSGFGTNAKCRYHHAMSEFEGKAENICSH